MKLKGRNEMSLNQIEPHIFIIFGATGNLASRKLFPAIYEISSKEELKSKSIILGVARKDMDENSYRMLTHDMLKSAGLSIDDKDYSPWCDACLFYYSISQGRLEDYEGLAEKIKSIEKKNSMPGNRIFNMALPPSVFPKAIVGLSKAGLNHSPGWTRLVVEKPFGYDFESAKELNNLIHKYFDESQIYRIDHFLGKETVQNLMVFRFANAFFEHLWSREHIESVEITVAEKVGIEGRANYYDKIGALRDMVQNHLTQLLTMVAMEIPVAFEANSIRNEKVKVLQQIAPITSEDVVFGQYIKGKIDNKEVPGYRDEEGTSPDSDTETFIALKMEIANWRWKGVPFYLQTGKRMTERLTEIVIRFHCAPISIFKPYEKTCALEPNVLAITIQPDEGFDLKFQVKSLGQPITLTSQKLKFRYSEAFGSLPDAYETLLLDVIIGDPTLFVRYDEVEAAWTIYDQLLSKKILIHTYKAGSRGPNETKQLFSSGLL